MKQHLNTLYVTSQESYLSKDGECVCVHLNSAEKKKIPIHTLESLILFGQVSCSPFLLGHCAENGVSVSWLTEQGRFLAAMHGPVSGNVLLRREQYRKADDPLFSAALARAFTIGKVYNCRTMLRRAARDRPGEQTDAACSRLSYCLERLRGDLPLDVVRGVEGEAAQCYFSVFEAMLSPRRDEAFAFTGRNRRPPLDPVN